ncbi:HAD family hydrolase [uncultured Formosa sp.]|uniref:HAD family hydrolase n=1 Tax=uncultured Formosa sp. TaxID=255435 RepID=UPI00260C0BB2|nr:HAD family hydrolase [uncultured Formosa sp.]
MNYKAVIFDLDGTLVDSIEDLADAMNIVLKNNNFPIHLLNSYPSFIGHGIRTLVKRALPESERSEAKIDIYYKEMIAVYAKNCTNKTHPYNGISDLLNALTTKGLKLGVFSNKAEDFTKRVVEVVLSQWNFEAVIGLTTEALKKPNPLKAIQFSETIGVSPEAFLFVGDSGVDMQTGTKAGMHAVGVLWGFRDEKELRADGAKTILKHPLDLLKILE